MRIFSAVCIAGAALALCLPGCVAKHASALDESKSQLETDGQTPADLSDPFGSCVVDESHPSSYPFPGGCSQGGSCDGISSLDCLAPDNSGDAYECEHAEFWRWCMHECETDTDCPQPATGDVAAQCLGATCHLPCSEGDTCPDGLGCWSPSEIGAWSSLYSSLCVQYFELTDFTVPPFPSP